MDEKIRLLIKGLSYSQTQSGAYALVLGEENGSRKLPVIIGGFEAQSIAIALEKEVIPPRPLTHDLFRHFADKFNIQLVEVIIHKLHEGVFYAILVCEQNGTEEVLDARTSDAVALAIRFGCPIYTYEAILQQAGIILEDKGEATKKTETTSSVEQKQTSREAQMNFSKASLEELQKKMKKAVENEDYELAARLRDEIDRRSEN